MGNQVRFVSIAEDNVEEKRIQIDAGDSFNIVKKKILQNFGKKEEDTLGKVYVKQQIEIRDLDSMQCQLPTGALRPVGLRSASSPVD
jgi:hypothetical protein